MDEMFQREKSRPIIDLNVVPIMDMLVCVIFFLLLSTTFMGYTNLQVPPSRVSTVKDEIATEPLSPKIMGFIRDNRLQLRLEWRGKNPGAKTSRVEPKDLEGRAKAVETTMAELLKEFKSNYPNEATLQLSLAREVPYQILISMMDGARPYLPDVVLYSYSEVEARTTE